MIDPKPLWEWANERHATHIRKQIREGAHYVLPDAYQDMFRHQANGAGGYLTRDPIIGQYRFCNVFRELDRVTAWVRFNIRRPWADHEHLWIMLAVARYINWPPTLQHLMETPGAWPSHPDFSPAKLGEALEAWGTAGNKTYTGAYMIRAESNPNAPWYSWTKQRYIAEIVFGRLWEDRAKFTGLWEPCRCQTDEGFASAVAYAGGCSDCMNTGYVQGPPTLQEVWRAFQDHRYIGWGPFMAYQVVVDMRWTRYLLDAPDIQTWAAVGPGSRRGLNRLAGRPANYSLSQDAGLAEMLEIHRTQDQYRAPWLPPVDLSDIQNCLCETDKYLRVKQGEGRPRSTYVQGRGY